jgi:DNA-binding transcriptional MerR regulator
VDNRCLVCRAQSGNAVLRAECSSELEKGLRLTQCQGRQSDCDESQGYQVHEFAQLAGVTVRTLHHYDRLDILKAHRNQSGFRVYTAADFERLENIIALKFIGLPLKQIRAVLGADKLELGCALRTQLGALEEKKRRLEAVINTVRSAEAGSSIRRHPLPKTNHRGNGNAKRS